jgi:hypothetical protein
MLLALLLSCTDYTINEKISADLIVAPETIDFGHLRSGQESATKQITIFNPTTLDATIDHLELNGRNYYVDEDGFTIEAGSYHQFDVSYTPATFEHNEGYIDIYLNGHDDPVQSVWLNGNGDAPVINLDPITVNFGSPLIGCEPTERIFIENNGNVDLVVNDLSFMTNAPQEIHLNYGSLGGFPWTIAPSARIAFFLDYIPLDESDDTLTFEVESNDPLVHVYGGIAEGSAKLSNEVMQSWYQENNVIVDIIWVIDNSGSMNTFQNLLGINMGNFMNMFLSFSPDYQIAFITTDNPTFVGNVITPFSGDPSREAADIIDSIGTRGSAHEKGLDQLYACFTVGQCANFVRPDAKIVAIFMSDEPDYSQLTPAAIENYFTLNSRNEFIPFGIIGDVPTGCSTNTMFAGPSWGYWDLIDSYGSMWWSICDSDWGSQMQEIALFLALKSTFELSEPDPVVDTIKVYVNGQELTEGWEYVEEHNHIAFDSENVPSGGDTIEIGYSYWGCTN